MSLIKKDIIKNISFEAHISLHESKQILESFLHFIKSNSKKRIKISNFGVFYIHKTPERIGRNPKTKETFKIPKLNKLNFKASQNVKNTIN